MFIGHFAVAFASKKVAPKVSLGTLVIAAAFLDAVLPFLRAIPALAKGEGAFEQSARAQSRFRKS